MIADDNDRNNNNSNNDNVMVLLPWHSHSESLSCSRDKHKVVPSDWRYSDPANHTGCELAFRLISPTLITGIYERNVTLILPCYGRQSTYNGTH